MNTVNILDENKLILYARNDEQRQEKKQHNITKKRQKLERGKIIETNKKNDRFMNLYCCSLRSIMETRSSLISV